MSFLNDLLKIGGTVAQFVPGGQVLGQAAGALGGILDASGAAKKKRQMQGQIQTQADKLGALGDTYTNLAATNLPGLTTDAIDSYKDFDPSTFIDPQYRAIIEGAGSNADNAVDQTMQDFAGRGLGRDSSGLGAAIGGIRASTAQTGARTMSDLVLQAQKEKQNRLLSALGLVQNLGTTGASLTNQSIGTMGGLEGMYASETGALGDALGQIGSIAGQVAGKRGAKAGNGTLNTNNAGTPSVMGGLMYDRDPVPTAPVKKVKTVTGGA